MNQRLPIVLFIGTIIMTIGGRIMIRTKTNNRVKKTLISMAVLGMAFFLLGCYKQQTQGEVEEYVANTVPEKAKLVGYEEQQSKSGTVALSARG